jgi:hypothetical protein
MGKYDKYSSRSRMPERPWKIHPIWRGIGCLLMLLLPVVAYAGAVMLVNMNAEKRWLPTPRELTQTVTLPLLGPVDNFYSVLIMTFLLAIIGFGLVTIMYSIIYSAVGPPRLGPLDAPPVRTSPSKKKY